MVHMNVGCNHFEINGCSIRNIDFDCYFDDNFVDYFDYYFDYLTEQLIEFTLTFKRLQTLPQILTVVVAEKPCPVIIKLKLPPILPFIFTIYI